MKRLILISLTLAVASLACLQTAVISETPSEAADPVFAMPTEAPAGAVYEVGDGLTLTPSLSLTGEGEGAPRICAVVVAEISLHLRGDASAGAAVLDWLERGEVVRVIDRSGGEWWLVQVNGLTGYVRAKYLEERGC